MPELDHLIYAARDLADGVARIEGLTGAAATPGGQHLGLGTHNALLTFDDRVYFEIIAIDPDQPDPPGPRPFGLDQLTEPALVGYAIHPTGDETLEDVVAVMTSAGVDHGTVASMSREKPDGSVLSWRLTRGGNTVDASDGALPFAIDWGDQPSPAVSLPSMGELVSLTVHHPDPTVRVSVAGLGVGVATAEGSARLVAEIRTPSGLTTLQ